MIRFLPFIIELGLLIYCLIDCIQSDPAAVRTMPKIGWVILIVLIPLVGGIAWLLAGRPLRPATDVPWRSTQAAGYPEYERPAPTRPTSTDDIDDIDERLRRDQERVDREHEEALKRWEESQRERERKPKDDGTG